MNSLYSLINTCFFFCSTASSKGFLMASGAVILRSWRSPRASDSESCACSPRKRSSVPYSGCFRKTSPSRTTPDSTAGVSTADGESTLSPGCSQSQTPTMAPSKASDKRPTKIGLRALPADCFSSATPMSAAPFIVSLEKYRAADACSVRKITIGFGNNYFAILRMTSWVMSVPP